MDSKIQDCSKKGLSYKQSLTFLIAHKNMKRFQIKDYYSE